MPFRVQLHRRAVKALEKLPKGHQGAIAKLIDELRKDPYPNGADRKQLQGPLRQYLSARCGNYRVCYEIKQQEVMIYVLVLGDRKEVYRLLQELV